MKNFIFACFFGLTAAVAHADLKVFATVPEWGALATEIGGDKVKVVIKVRNGIETEVSKKIQRLIKDSKLKVQAAIQGDAVRVTGAKRDDLQAAMALIRKDMTELPLSFDKFRD